MDIVAVWLIDSVFFLQDCGMYCMSVISLFHRADSTPFCNSYYLFTLLFLSNQTRHGRKIFSFYFFSFIRGRTKCYRVSNVCGHERKSRRLVLQLQSADFLER